MNYIRGHFKYIDTEWSEYFRNERQFLQSIDLINKNNSAIIDSIEYRGKVIDLNEYPGFTEIKDFPVYLRKYLNSWYFTPYWEQ